MSLGTPQVVKGSRITGEDFDSLSLHDCYIYGVTWQKSKFEFRLDIDFILEWIEPEPGETYYTFKVSEAMLCFQHVSDAKVELAWGGIDLVTQISDVVRTDAGFSPNGTQLWKYNIELSEPDGEIWVKGTGFELFVTSDPVVIKYQTLRE